MALDIVNKSSFWYFVTALYAVVRIYNKHITYLPRYLLLCLISYFHGYPAVF